MNATALYEQIKDKGREEGRKAMLLRMLSQRFDGVGLGRRRRRARQVRVVDVIAQSAMQRGTLVTLRVTPTQ